MNDYDLELHDGHRERIRRRIMRGGLDVLAPHELIEFLLFYAIPRQDVNDLAHQILEHFGSLPALLHADLEELLKVEGLNEAAARWLYLVMQNALIYSETEEWERITLKNYAAVFQYALKIRQQYQLPCAVQLCLDRDGALLYQSEFALSPRWGEAEAFRNALSDAICSEARDVILLIYTHQHTPVASFYDITHARSYSKLMRGANCELLDVVLVGKKNLSSLRRSGLISGQGKGSWSLALHEDYLRDMPAGDCFPVSDYLSSEEND